MRVYPCLSECVVRTMRAPGVRSCSSDPGASKTVRAAVGVNTESRTGSSDAALAKGERQTA